MGDLRQRGPYYGFWVSAARSENFSGWSTSNAFCGIFAYFHFVPVSKVAFSHQFAAAESLMRNVGRFGLDQPMRPARIDHHKIRIVRPQINPGVRVVNWVVSVMPLYSPFQAFTASRSAKAPSAISP
jgi:hypothetical protein